MFKKKENTVKVSGKISKGQANDLALLIARMQKNADQVEKDVLRAEEKLALDTENEKKDLPLQYQKENADSLAEAEGLLKDLFLDVDKAKKLKHPQASEIESDVILLHDRWFKDCAVYRELYEQIKEIELAPRIDWAQVLNQKQRQVNAEEYGPSMSDLEKQIASHNILHKEIEAYSTQLNVSSTSSKEEFAAIQKQYNNLLDNSKWRRQYLGSLYDFMQGCNKELTYLGEEQAKIVKRDWSDRIADAPDVRRQYENFKNNSLLSHESEVNKLQDDGDRLVEMKHPASSTIQNHRDTVRNEWQKFLNLCICQESHLDNVEEYKKYQLDADTLSESLAKLNSTLDPKAVSNKSNSQILLQLEGEERALQRSEQLLADLRKRSTGIAPLKLRRTLPSKPVSVESLCDWSTDKASVTRGEKLTLKSNLNNEKWEVQASNGVTKTLPGVCFLVPPPDPEAIDKADKLGAELADLKKRRAALQASLKNHTAEVTRPQQAAPVSAAPENPKSKEIASQLDKLDADLAQTQQNILSLLRAPLNRSDPAGDLAKRLKEQEKAAQDLKSLEQKKAAAQAEMEPLLSQQSSDPVSSALPLKLSAAKNKHDDIAALADLYAKKANASLNLENQIKKVDGIVSGFEKQLATDAAVPDAPNAIQARTQEIQALRKDVAGKQNEMQKLSQDLEATEQLCSSLQKGYQEYCPDIRRQETEVKTLKNRYANVSNQLQERETLLQEAANKNQAFQSVTQSLNSFLNNLPDNKIKPSDDLSQVNAKQTSQKRVVEDIKRKGEDMDRVVDLSHDLQSVLNEYETNSDKYRSTLGATNAKPLQSATLADSVLKQEKGLVNRYAEVSAENNQLLNQMGLAKKLIAQNEEKVSEVAVQQQLQLQSQQRAQDETDGLKKELADEITRRTHAETDLETFSKRMMSLKSRRGVERVEEKEVLQYYRDPKLESDLEALKNRIHEESLKRSGTQTEIEVINEKIISLENELKNAKPKLVTKEVTEIERDPQLDLEASKLRDEIRKMKDEIRVRETETVQMKSEVTILEQKPPNIKEKVVKKEVVRLEKDPEMVRAVKTLEVEIADEGQKSKSLNDEIFQTRSQINTLERIIPTVQPKVVIKEVKKVEQDPELINESKKLQGALDEEKTENSSLVKEISTLQLRYDQVSQMKPKVEIKEMINEIYRVDPETEVELVRLRKELQESSRQRSNLQKEIDIVMADLQDLRSQKPKVEMREVIQEVVKEERSPEIIREMQRLNDQVSRLQSTYDNTQDQLNRLRKERDEWKAEKSKVETKLVTREVIKYEKDPLLEKEADRLRREVREETQRRRTTEEMVFDLQNKYILLERQKPEEKVVVQEVVRLEKDPSQMLEHEKLSRALDEEVKSRRQLDLEVQQLRALVQEKERILQQSDERQKKIQVEMELRQIKSRIHELENAPPPIEEKIVIEEVLKVERDPKLEKLTNSLRTDLDKDSNDIMRLERDIRNLTLKIEILQREKSVEKTVYKEVIRVEKDQAVEAERAHLREQASQARNARRDLEDEIRRLTDKLNRLQTTKTSTSREEATLIQNRDALLREKENLTRELKTLESERQDISISFQQQSKLMSERNQMNRQKSIKMESDVQRLEREILDEKDKIHKRENTIRELQNTLKKEDSSETHMRETNVSTKITILDPETGKDMSPYDAYMEGLIDRNQYIHLQELECDWEEITSVGPDGETSVLQDRKSGKQYSIKNALKDGRLTQYDLQRYKDGKMPISEFALLVAGEKSKKPSSFSPLKSSTSPLRSSFSNSSTPSSSSGDEHFPISGVLDTTTNSRMSVRSAMTRKLIDTTTGQKLLEAQAATGGIVDIGNKDRYSVHKAAERGLIDSSHLQRLLNAQKAFTGVEDPVTKERLSIGEAVQKGWMPKDNAMRYMEAQYLTGGLVDPNKTGRISILDAVNDKMINSTMLRELQEESNYAKEIVDPITKEKINYKQAMTRCQKDPISGLLLLPAASTESSYTPTYSSLRSSYGVY
ncbi:envoplakin a [Megalops cyprinoides]|uniref:envoplakin a n=1 Tax=Megalops cyprinoides TaxID=118141 RepID=UPI001863E277|nr:envoplakin a [Megalops cyprinoides]